MSPTKGMSALHSFFSELNKERASPSSSGGTRPSASEARTIEKLFGTPTPATVGSSTSLETRTFHIAVQGCCHGELTKIYAACASHEAATGKKIDFLICCGDFQSTACQRDLASMAVPEKYRTLGDFPQYCHGGGLTAPYLTVFVGGNHENSDQLASESYGGFVAPNIYYLGHSGVITIDGVVRVAGLSGIFKSVDYRRPYPPRPYACNEHAKRSAYHVRRVEVEKLNAFFDLLALDEAPAENHEQGAVDGGKEAERHHMVHFMVSHDWPAGITKYGDEEQLLRYKPYFRDEVAHNALGNPHTMQLLRRARPQYWTAAHLHCQFSARVSTSLSCTTQFRALDKCAKGKGFLEFLDVPVSTTQGRDTDAPSPPPEVVRIEGLVVGADRIVRHPLWLRVLRATHAVVAQNPEALCVGSLVAATAGVAADRNNGTPSTAALLASLGLVPAVPLQTPLVGPSHQTQLGLSLVHSSGGDGRQRGGGATTAAVSGVEEAPDDGGPLGWETDVRGGA